ncbi:Type IV leader peptidase family protein [Shimia sp. SK013]|uniref:A24 family peptidase n=1 Tax=Shimia sp. SK013 TaxID=1389006 RepID=UPI0006B4A101|nr:prepilin peptidase [Shimia sp. SK013]KPA21335.1 Type IV leader peptidase family protein [Shimia sp. SK013]
MMHIPATTAFWFLLPVLPICVHIFFVDMKYKKISNRIVWVLFLVFVIFGLLLLPFEDFLWRFANYGVVFVVGLLMWMLRQVGAGDVKLAAVMALFIDPADAGVVMWIAFAAILGATAATLLARWTPLKRMAPDWAAWRSPDKDDPNTVGGGTQFTVPMGTGLGLMLCAYLIRAVMTG